MDADEEEEKGLKGKTRTKEERRAQAQQPSLFDPQIVKKDRKK